MWLAKVFRFAVLKLPLRVAVSFANVVARLFSSGIRFSLEDGLLLAKDGEAGHLHWAGTPKRGLLFLVVGLNRRGQILRSQYLLDHVDLSGVEVVVDVGANSGDFMLALGEGPRSYLGIEPLETEFRALARNADLRGFSVPIRKAAGEKFESVDFFVSAVKGDSSIIRPASGFTRITKVQMQSLDDILSETEQFKEGKIDLLKVEAEGYEPEVLLGASKTIRRSNLVVVDGGPERGKAEQSTIESCTNILTGHGLKLLALNLTSRPGVALFSRVGQVLTDGSSSKD